MRSREVTDLSSEKPHLERDVEREMPLPSGSICRSEDQQLWFPKGLAGSSVGPKRRSTPSTTSVSGGTRRWRLPVEVMRSVQRGKEPRTISLGKTAFALLT